MTGAPGRGAPAQAWAGVASFMSEDALMRAVVELAEWNHLLCYHTRDSRHSTAGFPDLVLTGPGGTLFVELKSETGNLRPEQRLWRDGLKESGQRWDLWRPPDWRNGKIKRTMRYLVGLAPWPDPEAPE